MYSHDVGLKVLLVFSYLILTLWQKRYIGTVHLCILVLSKNVKNFLFLLT